MIVSPQFPSRTREKHAKLTPQPTRTDLRDITTTISTNTDSGTDFAALATTTTTKRNGRKPKRASAPARLNLTKVPAAHPSFAPATRDEKGNIYFLPLSAELASARSGSSASVPSPGLPSGGSEKGREAYNELLRRVGDVSIAALEKGDDGSAAAGASAGGGPVGGAGAERSRTDVEAMGERIRVLLETVGKEAQGAVRRLDWVYLSQAEQVLGHLLAAVGPREEGPQAAAATASPQEKGGYWISGG